MSAVIAHRSWSSHAPLMCRKLRARLAFAQHPYRFPATTDRRSALPEAPAEPFMTIRHTITGEITTTGYNAAARRILLQAGFEETPGCACRATEPGTERTHGPARQPASCSSPTIPCTWTEPSVAR